MRQSSGRSRVCGVDFAVSLFQVQFPLDSTCVPRIWRRFVPMRAAADRWAPQVGLNRAPYSGSKCLAKCPSASSHAYSGRKVRRVESVLDIYSHREGNSTSSSSEQALHIRRHS